MGTVWNDIIIISTDWVVPMDNDTLINELNTVLRGELMAVESYDLFIANTDDEKSRQLSGNSEPTIRSTRSCCLTGYAVLVRFPARGQAYRVLSRKSSWSSKQKGKTLRKYLKELISVRTRE